MAEAFQFELVSPERLLVSEQVESVVIPGAEGEMTVMANHAPVMTTVKPGVVTVRTAAGATERYVVFGGFADILPSGCTLACRVGGAGKGDGSGGSRQAYRTGAPRGGQRPGRSIAHKCRAVPASTHHARRRRDTGLKHATSVSICWPDRRWSGFSIPQFG